MKRRSFIGSLAALAFAPFAGVGRAAAFTNVRSGPGRYWPSGRNSGRTTRALKHAVKMLDKYQTVVFVVATEREIEHAERILYRETKNQFLPPYYVRPGVWTLPRFGKCPQLHFVAVSTGGRGQRAHFVLDHTVWELPAEKLDELQTSLSYAHVGEWPLTIHA